MERIHDRRKPYLRETGRSSPFARLQLKLRMWPTMFDLSACAPSFTYCAERASAEAQISRAKYPEVDWAPHLLDVARVPGGVVALHQLSDVLADQVLPLVHQHLSSQLRTQEDLV